MYIRCTGAGAGVGTGTGAGACTGAGAGAGAGAVCSAHNSVKVQCADFSYNLEVQAGRFKKKNLQKSVFKTNSPSVFFKDGLRLFILFNFF